MGSGIASGNRQGLEQLETVNFKSNSAETTVSVKKRRKFYSALAELTATVDVANSGSGATVTTEGVAGLIDSVTQNFRDQSRKAINDLGGRELLDITRRVAAQQLELDDGGFDPDADGTYDLTYKFVLPARLPFMRQPFDSHYRGLEGTAVHDLIWKFSQKAHNNGGNGDDDGTGELFEGGTSDVTWNQEPQVELTEESAKQGVKPLYMPRWKRYSGQTTFTTAQGDYRIPVHTSDPILMVILRAYRTDTGEPMDVFNDVTLFGMEAYDSVPVSGLRIREQRDFQAVTSSVTGSVGILLADGGLWSNRLLPTEDFEDPEIVVDAAAPAGSNATKIDALVCHAIRENVGTDVRKNL